MSDQCDDVLLWQAKVYLNGRGSTLVRLAVSPAPTYASLQSPEVKLHLDIYGAQLWNSHTRRKGQSCDAYILQFVKASMDGSLPGSPSVTKNMRMAKQQQ